MKHLSERGILFEGDSPITQFAYLELFYRLDPRFTSIAELPIINSEEGEKYAQQLWNNITFFRKIARKITHSESAILPLFVYDEKQSLSIAQQLWERGFYIPAIRYPTVARGQARLRITLRSIHTQDIIQQLIESIENGNIK